MRTLVDRENAAMAIEWFCDHDMLDDQSLALVSKAIWYSSDDPEIPQIHDEQAALEILDRLEMMFFHEHEHNHEQAA